MHIFIANDFHVRLTEPAFNVIKNYYICCRHAKLMLRTDTSIVDTATAVMLMESSWTFGHMIGQVDVMKEKFPLGPSKEYVTALLELLELEELSDKINVSENDIGQQTGSHTTQEENVATINLDNVSEVVEASQVGEDTERNIFSYFPRSQSQSIPKTDAAETSDQIGDITDDIDEWLKGNMN